MALRIFHPCAFGFRTTDIRRVGNVVDGGTSLSGFQDEIETTGGGHLQADFTNGFTRDKLTGNAWRALADMDGDEAVVVMLCAERLFQPVGAFASVPHSDATPFSDGSEYDSGSSGTYVLASGAALRATTMSLSTGQAAALIGGEIFSIEHPNWGWRAYRVRSVAGDTITFRTPLREAVTAGTALEFDRPRCQMRKISTTSNATEFGKFGQCAISFGEDMRPPAS